MTTLKESGNRVHKFEKNGWLELYLPTNKSINYLQEDGPEDTYLHEGLST